MLPATEGGSTPVAGVAPPARQPMIVLQPLSHPQLAAIQIHDNLFAIGRTEAPFDSYPPETVLDLSRRHARIFCEQGAVYLADLDSKNGTTVNGVAVKQAITALHHGDRLGLGKRLSYRVRLADGPAAPQQARRLASLTLTPEHAAAELQPVVVAEFPFLVSKADPAFARPEAAGTHQLNYLSRRHAHLFLKGGQPFVEDLGSTNGTFVNGARLDEHARALHEGDLLAFGGHHFVYRLGLQWEALASEPTVTRVGMATAPGTAPGADKTTFVAAADSFLDIFCVDPAPVEDAAAPPADAAPQPARPQGRAAAWLEALGGKDMPGLRRARRWGMAALLLVAVMAWSLSRIGAAEREAQALLDSGAYAEAAAVAGAALARDPDNARLGSLATAALLKARLPAWMALLKARQFPRAAALVEAMRRQGRHNGELEPLLAELEWLLRLEAFVAARGGAQTPVASPADAAGIALFLKQWEEQDAAHQRAFVTMAAYVPQYRDAYAAALSDVRKLALARGQEQHEPAAP